MRRALMLLSLFAVAGLSQTLINGAGATFPYPIYSKWFDEFHNAHPDAQINYQAIGSGGGIRQLEAGTVDFGASDMPLPDAELKKFHTRILHFPTVLGAVVPMYNIPGVHQELNFTPAAMAGIYMGTVKKWNDPLIARHNPGVDLPAKDIQVVHRSDGSGTTFIWTNWLSKTDPEWKAKVGEGTAVRWPVGMGAAGNPGVAGLVKQTPNSIGYVELIYAIQNHMSFGRVQNSAGVFLKASLEGVTAAAAGAAANMPADFRVSITNAPGKAAYPISSFTWLLIPTRIPDATKRKDLVEFLRWMMGPGQKYTEALAYAPLPKAVAVKEEKQLSLIQ